MKAVILAAGLGTRLGDLANVKPKCLVELNGSTILETQINMLNKCGINDISIVIGSIGGCWSKENQENIREIASHVIINPVNTETSNTYSLRLALEQIKDDDLLVIDGDLIFSQDLLGKIINDKKNLILSKESLNKEDKRNKIISDENGKVLEMGKHMPLERVPFPYIVYGALIKIEKKNFGVFKKLVDNNKYYNLSLNHLVNELCKDIHLYKITDGRWVNVNNKEELEEARKICQENS